MSLLVLIAKLMMRHIFNRFTRVCLVARHETLANVDHNEADALGKGKVL